MGFNLGPLSPSPVRFSRRPSSVVFVIKKLTQTEETMVITFYFAFFATLFSAIPAAFVWQPPTFWEFVLLFTAGLFGIIGQSLFTYGLGETTFLMPFDYLRIVYSFFIGIFWFSEIPGLWSYLGSALIVLSSFYLIRTESIGKQGADESSQAVNSSRR
jgi:drug/metabolite transporter (DMT)-like permease